MCTGGRARLRLPSEYRTPPTVPEMLEPEYCFITPNTFKKTFRERFSLFRSESGFVLHLAPGFPLTPDSPDNVSACAKKRHSTRRAAETFRPRHDLGGDFQFLKFSDLERKSSANIPTPNIMRTKNATSPMAPA